MHMDGGGMIAEVNGKPACIVTKLPGAPRAQPSRTIAAWPASSSRACTSPASSTMPGSRTGAGARGANASPRRCAASSRAERTSLIAAENRYQAIHDDTVLPQGVIHGDYFHDNVLWDDEGSPGVIDFYFACDDALAYDVAIGVNDWCVTKEARLDAARVRAFLEGYESRRPFTDFERSLWPVMLRRAALRTWLGRLGYNHFPRESHMTIPKDHAFSQRLLEHHIAEARPLGADGA
jgi:homoserine kinase type II